LETRNPRSNVEDDVAWCVLAVGTAMTATGCFSPYLRLRYVPLVALAAPFVAFAAAASVVWSLILLGAILHAIFRLGL
jgi:hypothetical protein